MNFVKRLYNKIMPASKKQVDAKFGQIDAKIDTKINNLRSDLQKMEKENQLNIKNNKEILEANNNILGDLIIQQNEIKIIVEENKQYNKQYNKTESILEKNTQQLSLIIQKENEAFTRMTNIFRASNEIVWSSIFHDTIKESDWLIDKTFSPGRWAAGYPFLYILFKCLDVMAPTSILELGLGQTTRMIGQYAKSDQHCEHYIVEHDDTWIEFFGKSFSLAENSNIIKLNLSKSDYLGDSDVTVYEEFEQTFSDKKFDLISVDAPFGGDAYLYSRVDILKLLPKCLKKNFVILVDDFNRKGEKNTVIVMEEILSEHDIKFFTGKYQGNKETYIIASEELGFLCSM